jgi:hypothetical protein
MGLHFEVEPLAAQTKRALLSQNLSRQVTEHALNDAARNQTFF